MRRGIDEDLAHDGEHHGLRHSRDAFRAGYALNVLRADTLPWTAQIAMRAAVQPWMDEPIAYPLLEAAEPRIRATPARGRSAIPAAI